MKCNLLFYKLYQCTKPVVICQGGGDSGKTVSILQNIAVKLTQQPKQIATVTGTDLPNIKGGVLRTFQNYVLPDVEPWIRQFNKSESIYYFKNGSVLEFKAFESEQDARGSERDYLFINECNGLIYQMFWQLQRKTRKQSFLDYNPTSAFWVHDKLIGGFGGFKELQFVGKVQIFITNHWHNEFLTPEQHSMYESISDPDLYRVYAKGLTGKIKGLIFGHFKKGAEEPEWDKFEVIWGLDYGYTSDPTALVKIAKLSPIRRFGKECSYEPGLSAENLSNILTLNGYREEEYIYSEADPNMINQLRLLGYPVAAAIKGPGSVAAGIGKVREHECFYMGENFEKEINTYKFLSAQDIITGSEVTTNVPVKGWDHLCDAFRYADYTDSFRMGA